VRATAIVALVAFAAVGCGASPDAPPASVEDQGPYLDALALPADKPAGLTDVQVERFANPERDGQRVMLVFGDATVYVCSRHVDESGSKGTPCPYPDKQDLFTVPSGRTVETVYALDAENPAVEGKGGSAADTEAIRDELTADVEMQVEPAWFVELIEGNGK